MAEKVKHKSSKAGMPSSIAESRDPKKLEAYLKGYAKELWASGIYDEDKIAEMLRAERDRLQANYNGTGVIISNVDRYQKPGEDAPMLAAEDAQDNYESDFAPSEVWKAKKNSDSWTPSKNILAGVTNPW